VLFFSIDLASYLAFRITLKIFDCAPLICADMIFSWQKMK